jgi:glycosyltransferase involved in cell wall biosynthesis
MSGTSEGSMRILEIEAYGRGGLAHYVNNLSRALAARGHQVTLITAAEYELEGRTDLPENLRVEQRTARASGRSRNPNPGLLFRTARRLEAIYDAVAVTLRAWRLRPDVVHLHSTNSIAVLYLALLRLMRRPLVYTAHVVTPHERMQSERTIHGWIHRFVHLIVAHSEFDRQRLQDEFFVDPERVTVIPHGDYGFFEHCSGVPDRLEARQLVGVEPQDEVALFFGYIREYKGLDLLLEAWPEIAAARPRARLVIAGDPARLGPSRLAELKASATRLGAIHRFDYIPFSEVTRYFAAADVLVMPYRHISQSGVLFLGLALGLPVVTTRVGGLPEILQHGESALLVPPESTSELAAALIRVLGEPDLRTHLAAGGQRVAVEHSWDSIARRTEIAFARLAGPTG